MTATDARHARSPQNLLRRTLNLGNVTAALIGLGASIALYFLLPPALYNVVVGVGVVVAILSTGIVVHRRINPAAAPSDDAPGR